MKDLKFGIQTNGIKHIHADPMPDVDTRFRMVKDCGVFDYIDKTPDADQVDAFIKARQKYDLLVLGSGRFYTVGRDELMLRHNLELER